MENQNSKLYVLKLLRNRNVRESSLKDIIKYSNKLLESLDYLHKVTGIPKNTQPSKCEETALDSTRSDDYKSKEKYNTLQKELVECHTKISGLAEQVIKLKDALDEKNLLLSTQTSELEQAQCSLKSSQELCKTLKGDLAYLKKVLQDKTDEFDALNITYSSVENKKNDYEIENKRLQEQLLRFKEMERKSSSSESFESVFSLNTSTGSGKNLHKIEKTETVPEAKFLSPKLVSEKSNTCPDVALPGRMKYEFIAHDSDVNAVLWFPDSLYLITAGADRKVKLWEKCESDVKLVKLVRDCNSSVMSIDMDSEARLVLCASCDFASRVWTTSDFTIRHTLTGHSGKVASAKFINESNKIVSGSSDQTLKLWELPRTICTVTYKAQSPVNDVLRKDNNSIVSGHCDNKIRFWDVRTKSETANIPTSGRVTSLDISQNRNLLLCSEQSNTLKIFDMRVYKEVISMSGKNFEVGCNWTRAKFSPDGKYCCCGSVNGSVFIWNSSTGVPVRELTGHNSNVISCGWSLCGSYLATCEKNRKCIIWSK